MQNIQLNGVFSFMDNVNTIKLGDYVKLLINSNNKISNKAVGVYTINNKKIGYLPISCDQIDINKKFIISKIHLNNNNLQILISCECEKTNIIKIDEYINNKIDQEPFKKDLISLKKKLSFDGFLVKNILLTYNDEYYNNLLIEIINNNEIEKNIYYFITKKYYDEYIHIFDEFYKFKLINNNIYQPFKIHRLEFYILKNYKLLNKINNKINLSNYNVKINDYNIEEFNIDNNLINNNNICYSHEIQVYFYCNLYNVNNEEYIIEFNKDLKHNNVHLIKCILANKHLLLYNIEFVKKIYIIKN